MVVEFVPFLLLASVSGVAALYARLRGRRGRWRRLVRRLPPSTIATAPLGFVKLVGRSRAIAPPLIAPFSGRPCLAYEVEAFERDSEGERKVQEVAELLPFELVDDTGSASIRATASSLLLSDARTVLVEPPYARLHPTSPAGQWLRAWDLGGRPLRCVETILPIDAEVLVCGRAQRELDRDPGRVEAYREVPTRLLVVGDAQSPLLVATDSALVALGRR